MPSHSLTTEIGVRGPQVVLDTLFRRYFRPRGPEDSHARDEFLYDQAFHIVKSFLEAASRHTVEEIQQFSNIRIPSVPWIHSPRVLVPLSCCEDAAKAIIAVIGGEETANKVFGGTKWWQVRGIKGVDCQWISLKKDWQEAKRRRKEFEATMPQRKGTNQPPTLSEAEPEPEYTADMDSMRCMLYFHGGGYYFGSIDQERYCMQRFARKMNGRVFAVNYRLAPQYPFPCGIQDCLAAYLFLIRPPPGAKHAPVSPSMIVVAGDSAGGGLAIALLQVIRDAGLPMPAGAVLISPWCDLTHSFPSIKTNTATDIVPATGLSMHKPSTLWPPPSEEITKSVRSSLATKIKRFTRIGHSRESTDESVAITRRGDLRMGTGAPSTPRKSHFGSIGGSSHLKVPSDQPTGSEFGGLSASMSTPTLAGFSRNDPTHGITLTVDGDIITLRSQVQLYTTNNLLNHPLVSPVNAYLGGLCPLFILASDKEVLRDEIIYTAHRAAYPEKYPINPALRGSYPALNGIETRFPTGSQVHLQVFDETCHVLPLFSFTTPAKFAYRSIATFCKHVMPDKASSHLFASLDTDFSELPSFTPLNTDATRRPDNLLSRASSFRFSSFLSRRNSQLVSSPTKTTSEEAAGGESVSSSRANTRADLAGPRFLATPAENGPGTAGHPECYKNTPLTNGMLRERISTKGIVRPMEAEDQIPALCLAAEITGMVNEYGAKRYLDAQGEWDRKFKDAVKAISKARQKHIAVGETEDKARLTRIMNTVSEDEKNKVLNSPHWSWAWCVAGDENPPPSSIVARRDTAEARRLSKIADEAVEQKESSMSGNNLWALIVNALTSGPEHTIAKGPTERPSTAPASFPEPPASPVPYSASPVPTSPSWSIIKHPSGLHSSTSLSPSLSSDFTRLRRASFGSLRFGRSRQSKDDSQPNSSHRLSLVPDLPPALPTIGVGREVDGFAKSALEGIAEVRVSEDSSSRPQLASAPISGSTVPTLLSPVRRNFTSSPLSGGAQPKSPAAESFGTGGVGSSLKRKPIPETFVEEEADAKAPSVKEAIPNGNAHSGYEAPSSPVVANGDAAAAAASSSSPPPPAPIALPASA